jgi:hypothetical protein
MENGMGNRDELSIENHLDRGAGLDRAVLWFQPRTEMRVAGDPSFLGSIRLKPYLAKVRTFTRNPLIALGLSSIMMALSPSMLAQEQSFPAPSTTGTLGNKDAGALAEIKEHLQAVSVAGWQDLKGTGTLTYPSGNAHTATLYLMGSEHSRLDIAIDSGTRSLRLVGPVGRFQDEKGNQGFLPPATSCTGIVALPRIWAAAATSTLISLRDQQMYTGTGQSLHRITIEYPVDSSSGGSSLSKKTAATDLYFDASTHLLLYSVDSLIFNKLRKPLTRVTTYGGYQSFDGVLIPTLIRQALNGQEQWALQLGQVAVNTNPPADTFLF